MAETEVGAAGTETGEAPAPTRGRPRPADTIERDDKVLAAITEKGTLTNPGIVEATGIPKNQVYLSLYRLKRDGKITRTGGNWSVTGAAPEEAPAA